MHCLPTLLGCSCSLIGANVAWRRRLQQELCTLVQVFSVCPGPIIKPISTLQHHKQPITALGSAYQSCRGSWSDDNMPGHLVTADESGKVCVWEEDAAGHYVVLRELPGKVPCAALGVRKNLVICGQIDGVVKIYDLVGAAGGSCVKQYPQCIFTWLHL